MEDTKAFDEVTQKKKAPSSAWKPGESGNPAGRPKKNHALSAILATASKKNLHILEEGVVRKLTRNDLIAEILMVAVITGTVSFPIFCNKDGVPEETETPALILDTGEWIKLTDFYYKRVEGNPGTKVAEVDDDKYDGLTPEEAEEIAKERWKAVAPALAEALSGFDGEWTNETPTPAE